MIRLMITDDYKCWTKTFRRKGISFYLCIIINRLKSVVGCAGGINIYSIDKIEENEEQVDDMRRNLIADHIDRLKQGKCRPENNTIFINLVSNLERIGDHIYYIAR